MIKKTYHFQQAACLFRYFKRPAFHQAPINGDQITFLIIFELFLIVKVARVEADPIVPCLDPADLAQECVAHTSTRTGTLR